MKDLKKQPNVAFWGDASSLQKNVVFGRGEVGTTRDQVRFAGPTVRHVVQNHLTQDDGSKPQGVLREFAVKCGACQGSSSARNLGFAVLRHCVKCVLTPAVPHPQANKAGEEVADNLANPVQNTKNVRPERPAWRNLAV